MERSKHFSFSDHVLNYRNLSTLLSIEIDMRKSMLVTPGTQLRLKSRTIT